MSTVSLYLAWKLYLCCFSICHSLWICIIQILTSFILSFSISPSTLLSMFLSHLLCDLDPWDIYNVKLMKLRELKKHKAFSLLWITYTFFPCSNELASPSNRSGGAERFNRTLIVHGCWKSRENEVPFLGWVLCCKSICVQFSWSVQCLTHTTVKSLRCSGWYEVTSFKVEE